jgi:hypothetical protein
MLRDQAEAWLRRVTLEARLDVKVLLRLDVEVNEGVLIFDV